MRGRRVKKRNHRELGVLGFWLYGIEKYNEKLLKSFEDIKSNIAIQVQNPTIAFLNPKNSENQIKKNWCKNPFGRSDLRRLDVFRSYHHMCFYIFNIFFFSRIFYCL